MVKIKKDLTGQKFWKLTVIKQVEDYISPKGRHEAQWLCKCDCGNEVVVRGDCLRNHLTKSCGCLQKEVVVGNNKKHKKYNTYDLSGEYGIGYTSKGEEFWFDFEDYAKIKDYCWMINKKGYVLSHTTSDANGRKMMWLHRLIMDCTDPLFDVDHIHGEATRYDNRKSNLRIATRSQNIMNTGVKSNNTSGVTGVHWHKHSRKWIASITKNGKTLHKSCSGFDDAVAQRKKWEAEIFGEFSYDNSMNRGVLNIDLS